MSQLNSIEVVLRPVISAAFKSLENKTYDTTRADYMDVLLEDLFQILFPKPTAPAIVITTPVVTTTDPHPEDGDGHQQKKKKPGPKPKVDEHGNPVNSPRNRPKVPEEEKKKPGPKPKVDETGKPVNPPRNRKKEESSTLPPLPPSPIHIQKVDPTLRKKLKEAAKKVGIKFDKEDEERFLTWVNNLTVEEFKQKEADIAVKYFTQLTQVTTTPPPSPENPPQPPKSEDEEETALVEVFGEKGEIYWVDKQTGRIYEGEGEVDKETGAHANYKPLGYVGEGIFKNLKV